MILCSAGLVFFWTRSAEKQQKWNQWNREQQALKAQNQPAEPAQQANNPPAEQPPPKPPEGTPVVSREEIVLENKAVRFVFTNQGGGIARAELKDHKAFPNGNIVLNENGTLPIGELVRAANPDRSLGYQTSRPDDRTIVYSAQDDSKIALTKTYKIPADGEGDPYILSLAIDLKNNSDVRHKISDYSVYTGVVSPMHPKESELYLLYNWSEAGTAKREVASWFNGGGFLFWSRPPQELLQKEVRQLDWAGPCNQFYASLIVPTTASEGIPAPGRFWGRRLKVHLHNDHVVGHENWGLHGGVDLPTLDLAAGQSQHCEFKIYTGPREYNRLKDMGYNLAAVMHYDDTPIFGSMFGLIPAMAKLLLKMLLWLQSMVSNWGVAILLLVCVIRGLLWPIHAKSNHTMKRMAKLGPLMTEIKEKHKDNPQKMNQEMWKLQREYGVNPMGSCLLPLFQFPIFLGFYKMLQSAVELRNRGFLWVNDLSMPDSVYEFANFSLFGVSSLNLMPLLMTATMLIQMAIGPKAADKTQQRVLMFMPLIFLFICYNFASALSLYWTGQNIFSIFQTWIMNKRPEPELVKRPVRPALAGLKMPASPGATTPQKPKKRTPRTGG